MDRPSTPDESIAGLADMLTRRLRGLADVPLRRAYLRSWLADVEPARLADLWVVAVTRAEAGASGYGELLLSMGLALADGGSIPLREATAALLEARDRSDLAQMLRPMPEEASPDALRVPDYGKGRPLTLGERKALARTRDRRRLLQVLADPHPDVIRVWLGNPALTENDVVRLCARRPIAPDVLREAFRAERWVVRYRIKLAIVRNPHTPLDVALQLVPQLRPQHAREIAASPDLPALLRALAARGHTSEPIH